jgi:hypothetical protein
LKPTISFGSCISRRYILTLFWRLTFLITVHHKTDSGNALCAAVVERGREGMHRDSCYPAHSPPADGWAPPSASSTWGCHFVSMTKAIPMHDAGGSILINTLAKDSFSGRRASQQESKGRIWLVYIHRNTQGGRPHCIQNNGKRRREQPSVGHRSASHS